MNNQDKGAILPIILSGGVGSRLWPLSTAEKPKQFLNLISDKSLLQETITRVSGIESVLNPIIVSNQRHALLIREHLKQIEQGASVILLEPVGRNTAPAIAVAALLAIKNLHDPILLVLPSDHVITDNDKFHRAVNAASNYAQQDKLVTFGIVPVRAETGYGYIKARDTKIESFVEKPDLSIAEEYLKTGNYYWNSGMFMFRASVFLEELNRYNPGIFAGCEKAFAKIKTKGQCMLLPEKEFAECPSDSIDYAVMERTKNSIMVPLDAGWSDIGSFQSLWEYSNKDSNGNVIIGEAEINNVKNSYIYSVNRKITLNNLKNVVFIDTDWGFLATSK